MAIPNTDDPAPTDPNRHLRPGCGRYVRWHLRFGPHASTGCAPVRCSCRLRLDRPRPHLLGPAGGIGFLNLNADLGEGASEDEAILAYVDSASVACGVHAGSLSLSIATVSRCHALGVEVGAHPGYEDRANFGRVELPLSVEELEALVAFQVAGLAAITPINYVKP